MADALSEEDFIRAWVTHPGLDVSDFEPYRQVKNSHKFTLLPPRDVLGASKQ